MPFSHSPLPFLITIPSPPYPLSRGSEAVLKLPQQVRAEPAARRVLVYFQLKRMHLMISVKYLMITKITTVM